MIEAMRLAWTLCLLLAACARSEDASVLAEDNDEARAVEHVRSSEENDAAVALGDRRPSIQDDANILEFGPDGAPPIFSLRCDGRRGLYLQRHGAAPTGDLPMMLLTIADILMKNIFHQPVRGTFELVELSLVFAVFCGLPEIFRRDANIVVDVFDHLLRSGSVSAAGSAGSVSSAGSLTRFTRLPRPAGRPRR